MILSWNTTKKCNLYCEHCYRESGPDVESSNELTTTQGKQLIDEIIKAGFKILILSGGEPLLRSDIFELAEYASSNGLRPALGSNGTMISKSVAEQIKNSGISVVSVSLDSATADYHDKFRNSKGAWKKAVEGIKNTIKTGIMAQINTTLTENNFNQFEDIVNFAADLGVRAVHPFFLVPSGRGVNIEKDSLKMEKYFRMIKLVMKLQKNTPIELKPTCAPQFVPISKDMGIQSRFTRGCIAGINYCCILPDGDVHICPYLPVKVDTVKQKPFNEIWDDNKIFNELRDYKNYEGKCGECSNINICGGCRARAFHYNDGNFMSEDPWCNLGGLKIMDELDHKILNTIQKGIPLEEHPYHELARKLKIEPEELIDRIETIKNSGYIRRLGAVFNSSQMGYNSVLVGINVSKSQLKTVVDNINTYNEITHNYYRVPDLKSSNADNLNTRLNVWFTITTQKVADKERILKGISNLAGVNNLFQFPKLTLFKLRVYFEMEDNAKCSMK